MCFVIACFLIFAWLEGCNRSETEPLAKLKSVQGMVEARDTLAGTFASAKENQSINEGGAARTGKASSVRIVFADGSDAFVKSEAYFEVGKNYPLAVQDQGMVIYQFKKQKQEIKIKTPHGVTAVLGTTFLLDVTPEGTRLVLNKGKVSFTDPTGKESVVLEPGQSIFAKKGAPLGKPIPVDPMERESMFKGVTPNDAAINRQ